MAFMAKARLIDQEELGRLKEAQQVSKQDAKAREAEAVRSLSDITMIGFPTQLLNRLRTEAARRKMGFAELLSEAIADYLRRTEPEGDASSDVKE